MAHNQVTKIFKKVEIINNLIKLKINWRVWIFLTIMTICLTLFTFILTYMTTIIKSCNFFTKYPHKI